MSLRPNYLGRHETATNALKLGGRPPSDYQLAANSAHDSNKLGGKAANEYAPITSPSFKGDIRIAGHLTITDPWGGLDLKSTHPLGFSYIDFTGGGRTKDYDWRISGSSDERQFQFYYQGDLGSKSGYKCTISVNGHIWASSYGWLHDFFARKSESLTVYKGTNPNETNYPIGHIVPAAGSAATLNKADKITLIRSYTPNAAHQYHFSIGSHGTPLAGIWRCRGRCDYNNTISLYQRVA